MNALKRFTALPASQMATIVIALLATIGFLIGLWTWVQTPEYRVLFKSLDDKDGGAVIAALTQMNVPYKVNEAGSAIMVPAGMLADARFKLATLNLPKGGAVGYDLLDQQKFGTTQAQEQMNLQRGLEGELVKSIQTISAVQAARVHLALPKPTIFLREHQAPTASVVLSLYPGKTLDTAQVQGVVHLVASSVPELADANVSVVDGSGNLLSHSPEVNGLDPGKLGFVRDIENAAKRRVVEILEPIVGAGNARVAITADVDFNQTERTAETFSPNGTPDKSAMRSQQVTDSTNSSGAPAAGGVPGAQANTPTNAAAAAPGANANGASSTTNSSSKKDNTVNYELDRTVEVKRLAVGTVRRLSAAIVVNNRTVAPKPVDGKAADKGDAKKDGAVEAVKAATSEPLKKEEIDQITALAREAIGIDEKRGDTINVVNVGFTQAETIAPTEVPVWKDPDNLATAKEVGKNVGFALVAAYLLFGVLRPAIRRMSAQAVPVEPTATPQIASEVEVVSTPALAYPEHLQRARQLARDDPKALAGLVRNWVAAE